MGYGAQSGLKGLLIEILLPFNCRFPTDGLSEINGWNKCYRTGHDGTVCVGVCVCVFGTEKSLLALFPCVSQKIPTNYWLSLQKENRCASNWSAGSRLPFEMPTFTLVRTSLWLSEFSKHDSACFPVTDVGNHKLDFLNLKR